MNEPIVEPLLAVELEFAFQTNAPLIPRELGRWARARRRHRDHDLSRVLDRRRGLAGRRRLASLALGCVARRDDPGEASAWRRCRKPRRQSCRHRGASARGRFVHALSKAESEKLLEPWLGAGLDLSELPVPRLILLRLRGQGSQNLATLRKALASSVPQADLDDHRIWAARLGTMADAVVILAAALFALMIVAMGTAIGFATRGAMAGNREIIEVLHLVGASDAFIAREFQAHFRRLGLRGAMIGGLAAIAFFAVASLLSFWWAHSPGGDEIAAMFGSFTLGSSGYIALAVVCAAVTLLTGLLSRTIVMRHLQTLQ